MVVSVNEPDGGRYDCHLGGSLLCSYSITVDAHRYDENNNNNTKKYNINTMLQFHIKLLFFLLFLLHRCTPPNKGNDYQKIYSDWCHEFEKYKSAMKSWEKKQAVSVTKMSY